MVKKREDQEDEVIEPYDMNFGNMLIIGTLLWFYALFITIRASRQGAHPLLIFVCLYSLICYGWIFGLGVVLTIVLLSLFHSGYNLLNFLIVALTLLLVLYNQSTKK